MRVWLLGLALLCAPALAEKVVPVAAEHEARYYHLLKELRCLVCQNESLYESRADLAEDLRLEVQKMLTAGNSDVEILDFMVARYGDFVLYRPRVRPATFALWFGPGVLLLLGIIIVYRLWRRQSEGDSLPALDEAERERLNKALEDSRRSDT